MANQNHVVFLYVPFLVKHQGSVTATTPSEGKLHRQQDATEQICGSLIAYMLKDMWFYGELPAALSWPSALVGRFPSNQLRLQEVTLCPAKK